jgi:protein-disulfide reductase (glutathione)
LKSALVDSARFAEASKRFIMSNVEDDEEPGGEAFKPDGGYIPRIFFLAPDGEVAPEIINAGGNPQYKYYYANEQQLLTSMQTALSFFEAVGTIDPSDSAKLSENL